MSRKIKKESITVKTSKQLFDLLEIPENERAVIELKIKFSKIAMKAIEDSGMSVNEIVAASGVARSKVSAVKNGATSSISIDLIAKIIAATGTKVKVTAA